MQSLRRLCALLPGISRRSAALLIIAPMVVRAAETVPVPDAANAVPAPPSPVIAWCKTRPNAQAADIFAWCLENEAEIERALMTLSVDERRAFFEQANASRPPPDPNANDSMREAARCERVADVGVLSQPTYWVVRCDDERRYVVYFSPDGSVFSGLGCRIVENHFGLRCADAKWTLEAPAAN